MPQLFVARLVNDLSVIWAALWGNSGGGERRDPGGSGDTNLRGRTHQYQEEHFVKKEICRIENERSSLELLEYFIFKTMKTSTHI